MFPGPCPCFSNWERTGLGLFFVWGFFSCFKYPTSFSCLQILEMHEVTRLTLCHSLFKCPWILTLFGFSSRNGSDIENKRIFFFPPCSVSPFISFFGKCGNLTVLICVSNFCANRHGI